MISYTVLFPVHFVVWIVERVCTSHFEDRQVSTGGWSYILDVGELCGRLADNQWSCWWRDGCFDHVVLIVHTGGGEWFAVVTRSVTAWTCWTQSLLSCFI